MSFTYDRVFAARVRTLVIVAAYACGAFATLYVSFLGLAVYHAALRVEADSTLADFHTTVARLEAQYLSEKRAVVNTERSNTLGLAPVINKSYAERGTLVGRADTAATDF